MFRPWMSVSIDDYNSLEQCVNAGIYVLLLGNDGSLKEVPASVIKYMGYDATKPELLSKFGTIDQSYAKIKELSPVLKNIDHFMKYRHFHFLSRLVFETESDSYVAEEFLWSVGTSFGKAAKSTFGILCMKQGVCKTTEDIKKAQA